ncbi:YfdX family protein (plasmid) [Enterobacter asburiae]|uniref:YfdX family protein n=1 Tax=Enterobacter asburiae TaxID=61645 RepID=UPI0029337F4C|nr:YfdX family protein [Enterobacter asburiae]EMA4739799.1 YfdX family protein [Enterobacter asburiae]
MKRFFLKTFLVTVLAATATPVLATDNIRASDTSPNVKNQQLKEADQIAIQGLNAIRDIQMARLDLFQGHIERAEALTNKASDLLTEDSADWMKFARSDKKANLIDDKYVAIDASIGISEDFISSPEKKEAIKRANKKMENGDRKGAVEQLRLAGISVVENVYLMPLKQTRNTVSQAQKLMAEHKYYEANLALKGAEDGIILDSAAMFEK